jgi:hypothetical protein
MYDEGNQETSDHVETNKREWIKAKQCKKAVSAIPVGLKCETR